MFVTKGAALVAANNPRWCQIVVLLIVLLTIRASTARTRNRLGFQHELERPWHKPARGVPAYHLPGFAEGAYITASDRFISIAVAIRVSV